MTRNEDRCHAQVHRFADRHNSITSCQLQRPDPKQDFFNRIPLKAAFEVRPDRKTAPGREYSFVGRDLGMRVGNTERRKKNLKLPDGGPHLNVGNGRIPVSQCESTNVRSALEAVLNVALGRRAAVGRSAASTEIRDEPKKNAPGPGRDQAL